jgi:hypothetical protein
LLWRTCSRVTNTPKIKLRSRFGTGRMCCWFDRSSRNGALLQQHTAAQRPGLVQLGLRDNEITDRGAGLLGTVFRSWGCMERLDLRGNRVSPGCAELLRTAAVKVWHRADVLLV